MFSTWLIINFLIDIHVTHLTNIFPRSKSYSVLNQFCFYSILRRANLSRTSHFDLYKSNIKGLTIIWRSSVLTNLWNVYFFMKQNLEIIFFLRLMLESDHLFRSESSKRFIFKFPINVETILWKHGELYKIEF